MSAIHPFSSTSTGMTRRNLLQLAGTATVATGAAGLLGGCAAAPVAGGAAAGAAGAAINPAVSSWLSQIALGIAANQIGDVFQGAVGKGWQSWQKHMQNNKNTILGNQPWWYGTIAFGHAAVPTILISISDSQAADPMRDRMYSAVENGESAVIFDAWAWQGLSMYVQDLSAGKKGEDLNRTRTLSALSLIPAGTSPKRGHSPKKTVDWMTYKTHNGVVEIARIQEADGSAAALVTAEGIPNADGKPTIKKYSLPTVPA